MGIKEKAALTLQSAYEKAIITQEVICNHKSFIDYVIDNNHLTYKYVLFTALLSKATDSAINPLCLQKKSLLPGAYDARTVCHKVIVPFEMEVLKKALGGSNEPFLNKPARFTELDKTNAVRKGNDQSILNSLCDNLPLITTSGDAYQCLVYLLTKLIKIRDQKEKIADFTIEDSSNLPIKLMIFIEEALKENYEGEILTLVVAGLYHLLYRHNPSVFVEVHPVNQSGASGREASDLDIYISGALSTSNELKDKHYEETDVRHAADKVINAGGKSMLFIEGPRAETDGSFVNRIKDEYARKNFLLSIMPIQSFMAAIIPAIGSIDCKEFIRYILVTAQETKFKEEVVTYLDAVANRVLHLSRTE